MPLPSTMTEFVNRLNQNAEEIDGKKYAQYNLNTFVTRFLKNTDLTEPLKYELNRLGKETIYFPNSIFPYEIKDDVMQYLIGCGTWFFFQKDPYSCLHYKFQLTTENYDKLNKEYLKSTDIMTDQRQIQLLGEDGFKLIFFPQNHDGKRKSKKRQSSKRKSKRRQSSKRKSKKRQSSKRKSKKRQSSKRKSKRKSF